MPFFGWVKIIFQNVGRFHIVYVLDSMKECTSEIRNIRAYLLTSLYYAPLTMASYYEAKVRHDMPELFRRGA